jgi:hypothetical protein
MVDLLVTKEFGRKLTWLEPKTSDPKEMFAIYQRQSWTRVRVEPLPAEVN